MRNNIMTLVAAAVLMTGTVAAATSLYAADPPSPVVGGDMTGSGMMPMMQQMTDMAEHCSQMMQGTANGGSGAPNEQWRKPAPVTPEEDG
jgi:hypothetical protein